LRSDRPPRSLVQRFDAFDGLRGTLALLFLALHSSLAYVTTPLGAVWPFKDPATHIGFDIFAAVIHSFRLPLFFILAGFFAAMIYEARGPRGFLINRLRRIGGPLVLAWLAITPITLLAFRFAATAASPDRPHLASSVNPVHLQWFHLWFLFDLLIYYGVALLLAPVAHSLPIGIRRAAKRAWGGLLGSSSLPLFLGLITSATLLPMRSGLLETPGTFQRPISTLLADGVFVFFGWGLYLRRDLIPALGSHGWPRTIVGCLLFPAYITCFLRFTAGDTSYHLATVMALSACTWFLALGILGLFARYYRRSHPFGRYLAEASYWCYLIHLPLVVWIPLFLAPFPIPAAAKFALVFSLTTLACLLTYHFLVRRTRLGTFLSGRKSPGRVTASAHRGRSLTEPERAQISLLRHLVRRSAATVWGREHGYADLARCGDLVSEYQRRVPLGNHATLAPYVARMRDGEEDILWPGRTRIFAVSGGTESGGRVVPISREGVRYLVRASMAPGFNYLARCGGATRLLGGKLLSLPGGVKHGEFGPGTIAGEVSGLMAYFAPAATGWLQALPRDIMLSDDWNQKLDQAARAAIHLDVRGMIMVPSWAPALLDRVRVQVGLRSTREAVQLAWPNLRVFFSGGVALSSYLETLESLLGPEVAFLESYSASEGYFAFQERSDSPDLRLHVGSGVFYEFVPAGEHRSPAPTRHTIGSIEAGADYVLYVTNANGLWSCAVEDIVRFTSTRPPRLRVVGRAREVLDRFGEAMTGEHVRSALAEADGRSGARCLHAHVCYADPCGSGVPRHRWLLEFESTPTDATAYRDHLDSAARLQNGRYRKRREPGAMDAPILTLIPKGTTERYLEATRRHLSAQSKLVALSEDRDIANGLLKAAASLAPGSVAEVETSN
jgi:peptidoglycan/LPS O-acetylase OafA/YrhL